MSEIRRPALRWHGGKFLLAPWIIRHLPTHRTYVEPFGGAASVLLRKPRSYAEVYNDLEGEVVEFFRVLRDEVQAAELRRLLELTPFARDEFRLAYEATECRVETARRLVIRSFMGFGSDGWRAEQSTGFRCTTTRTGTTPAHDWAGYPAAAAALTARLRGVVIENREAVACMAQHDGPETLHYVDPPYVHETRSRDHRDHGYRHELTDSDHARLLTFLGELAGMVIVSGYPHPSYDIALTGWRRVEKKTFADGARARLEVLWINPHAVDRLGHGALFDAAAPASAA